MTREHILRSIRQRNELRALAKLPLLDVLATYRRELATARRLEAYRFHYDALRAEVLAVRRAKHGPDWGYSAGGRWAVEIEVRRLLEERYLTRAT